MVPEASASAPEPPPQPVPALDVVAPEKPVVLGIAPLAAPASLVTLEVPGFAPAVVALPLGAISRRPVLIATHGNYDRPEWQCETWAPLVAKHGFVLCPRGIARRDSPSRTDPRWEYATNQALEKELTADLAALRARFPDHVDDGAIVYTGFSLGAIMGVAIAQRAPATFSRLVLTEGGFDRWTIQSARAYAKNGGARVLFACGQMGCVVSARQSVVLLKLAGVEARVVSAVGSGHSYGGPVAEAIAEAFPWLTEGDARWAGE